MKGDVIKSNLFIVSRWFGALTLPLLSVITISLLFWTCNKGLDVTDEGIYLMASQFPMDVEVATSVYYIYTAWLYAIAGYNLVALRIIGILVTMGAAVLFFGGLYYLLRSLDLNFFPDRSVTIFAWSFMNLGALLHYAWWLLTPGYNLINSVAINAASGFLFLGLALLEGTSKKYLSNIAFCGAGLFVGISFLVKFSSGISLLIVISGILLVWPSQSFLNKIKNIASVGVGAIAWLSLHFGIVQSPVSWWQNFHRGVENALMISPAYGLINIKRYFLECMGLLKTDFLTFWKFYSSLLIIAGVLLWMRRSGRVYRSLPHVLLLILFAAAGWKSFQMYFSGGIGNVSTANIMIFYMAWLLILAFAMFVTTFYYRGGLNKWLYDTRVRLFLIGIILLVLPLAGVVGTGNPIYTSIFLYLSPWFALLLILLIVLSMLHNARWIFGCGALVIGILAFLQIACGVMLVPYRLNTGMLGQTVPTDIGVPTTKLLLDPATSEFFKAIQEAARANGFQPGNDVLAFSDMAGVVFSMGGRSPYITHYTSGYPGSHAANEVSLSRIPRERIRKAFILQNVSGDSWKNHIVEGTDGFPDLAKFGINFPGDYILCGEAILPYYKDLVRLWKHK